MMRAIFLDRDGTINHDSKDFIKNWHEFKFLPGSKQAIKMFCDNGFRVFLITNQSGLARGLFSEQDLSEIHGNMVKEIEEAGGRIDEIFYCRHLPEDGCKCRKPSPELIFQASKLHNIDLKQSYMIGDKKADIDAGRNAGCMTVLVRTGNGKDYKGEQPDIIANDLLEAAHAIIKKK